MRAELTPSFNLRIASTPFFNKKNLSIFLFILATGIFLRIYNLGYESLWNDEVSSWKRSNYDDIKQVILKSANSDVHPPLYQILLFYIEKYIGETEFILRFPSAISGICSIFVIYLLGVRLYSYKEGLIAAGLMAVSWAPIYYSQEARSYSTLILFAIISIYTWIPLVRGLRGAEVPPISKAFAYIIPAIICCYLHYYGVFLIGLQFIYTIIAVRRSIFLLQSFFVYMVIGVGYLPWLPTMIKHSAKKPNASFIQPSVHAFEYYIEFIFSKSNTIAVFVFLLSLFLILYALYTIYRNNIRGINIIDILSSGYLLALWFCVPFIIVFTKSFFSSPVFTNRNMLISLPAAYILVARAIMLLPIHKWLKYFAAGSMIIASLANLIFVIEYYTVPQKEQFREAVTYVVDQDSKYDNSIVISYTWDRSYLDYYFQRQGSNKRVSAVAGAPKDLSTFMRTIYLEHPDYIWYVAAHKQPENEFLDFIIGNFTVLDYKTFIRAEVWLLKNDFSYVIPEHALSDDHAMFVSNATSGQSHGFLSPLHIVCLPSQYALVVEARYKNNSSCVLWHTVSVERLSGDTWWKALLDSNTMSKALAPPSSFAPN